MMRTLTIALAGLLATAASADPFFVAHHLSFEEVDAVTGEPVARPSGSIDPGQGALIRLTVSFVPEVGVAWQHPYGFRGTIHAFGSSTFHLMGGHGTDGSWHSLQLAPGLSSNFLGVPMQGGRLVHGIRPAQEAGNANQANPFEHVWQGVWVPEVYTDRIVAFNTLAWGINPPYTSSLYLEDSSAPGEYVLITCPTVTDLIEIAISEIPSCYANCDGSTTEPVLTIDDFTCFINEFAGALALPPAQQIEHYANCDGSTTEPVLTVNDFTCFVNEFAQGCP